ncbi:hypothetical protein R6Z07F_014651 [Ovis aries]
MSDTLVFANDSGSTASRRRISPAPTPPASARARLCTGEHVISQTPRPERGIWRIAPAAAPQNIQPGPFSFFPASPPSTISRDLAQNIADRVGAILGLRLVVGEGKAAKGDYSKYRKPPPGIERSGTPRPGAPLVWQKVIELLRYEDHLLGFV